MLLYERTQKLAVSLANQFRAAADTFRQVIHDTQSAQISQKQDEPNIYAIMKPMCPPSYHHNGFVANYALGHMMHGYTLLVPMNQRVPNKLSKELNISGHK